MNKDDEKEFIDKISKLSDLELSKIEEELRIEQSRYNILQNNRKIALNSAYGAFGSQYYRYYDHRLAEAITSSGRVAVRTAEKYLNMYLNKLCKTSGVDYVVFAHTDSLYINLENIVKKITDKKVSELTEDQKIKIVKYLEKFSEEKLSKILTKIYDKLSKDLNVYENKMHMKLELIADAALWTEKKNRYCLHYYYKEGTFLEKPKIKSVGMEVIRSSTPSVCKSALKDTLEIVLIKSEKDLHDFYKKFKEEYDLCDFTEFGIPVSVNNLNKYDAGEGNYEKKCPSQVKGAILYNNYLRQNKLENKVLSIKEGEKVKTFYLLSPNPLDNKVISFPGFIPDEMKDFAEKYIDRKTMFEKTYIVPAKKILDIRSWDFKKKNKLPFIVVNK